jgi:hypothetical protein
VLSSAVSGVDIELKTEFSVRRARTLLAAKQFSQVVHFLAYIYTSMHIILFVFHSVMVARSVRDWRGVSMDRNTGRGPLPTAEQEEGFSLLILACLISHSLIT